MGKIITCNIKAPAKINLSLDVVGKREDGFHLLETVMQSIDLHDIIAVSLEQASAGGSGMIKILASNPTFPCDSRNTCYKAAVHFLDALQLVPDDNISITINITKQIPQAAGLAGGSADAAAVLIALNKIYGFPFSSAKLLQIGAKVGADVPFCLTGGTAFCKGIGEIIEPLPPLGDFPLVIIKADFGVSTPWVFRNLNLNNLGKRPGTEKVIKFIKEKNIAGLFNETANVLESVTLPEYPVLSKLKQALLDLGGIGSLMSGSGPTVFGFFESHEQAFEAAAGIRGIPEFSSFFIQKTQTIQTGPVDTAGET